MSFAVDDYRALVQLLLDHPEWRAELRPLILGEEFEDVPRRVGRLEEALTRLTEQVEKLSQSVDRLVASQERMDDRLARLEGHDLENRYFFHTGSWFGKWLRKARYVEGPDALDAVDAAAENGTITEGEMEALLALDMIVRGVAKKSTGLSGEVVFAVEVSPTIADHDVERAASRAAILRRVGYQAVGFVGGETVTRGATALAERENVIIDIRRP
jgi:hypothetical protein